MRRWWCASLGAAAVALTAAQAPAFRVVYRLRVVAREGAGESAARRLLATGDVRGPQETGLRLGLRTDSGVVEALFELLPFVEPDTLTLAGHFFATRRVGRTRRGLPLWEEDHYRRTVRLAWGDTARMYPFGLPAPERPPALWVELILTREPAGGETRPGEVIEVLDSTLALRVEAVARPRRVRVMLLLVRGDTTSAVRPIDLIVNAPARRVELVLGSAEARALEVSLTRPEPSRGSGGVGGGRDSVLALDADVVCLRVVNPDSEVALPARVACGRLNNVARRLPLSGADTLVATFAWPAVR